MELNDDSTLVDFEVEKNSSNIIKVLGVGGGGGNAVNHMFKYGIHCVDFVLANTDNQALEASDVPTKIQLGGTLTQGLGAGNNPEKGFDAATESIEDVRQVLGGVDNTKMLFVTAGMGGGTGTGAAPVIADMSKKEGILTVAIVSVPFRFEGPKRVAQAKEGLEKLKKCVDSVLVIDNEKILQIYGKLTLQEAFSKADDVLTMAAKGIAEIITKSGHVNVDFADVQSVMKDSGIALMGNGQAEGEDRAEQAIKQALDSPLLNNNDINGAKNLLMNISSSSDKKYETKLEEAAFICQYVQKKAGARANLIWGQTFDDTLDSKLNVTLIATGFEGKDFINPFETDEGYRVELSKSSNKDDSDSDSKPESEADDTVKAGEVVDLGGVDDDEYNDLPDDDQPVIQNTNFQAIDFSSIGNLEEYDTVPAYIRRGIRLNVGNYNDPKCQRTALNE
ncbi:MAG: cell division protein FtsZ [Bacteroidales bacterium]|nr:cell division protein FtsZ [Bacteroidales bacterium]